MNIIQFALKSTKAVIKIAVNRLHGNTNPTVVSDEIIEALIEKAVEIEESVIFEGDLVFRASDEAACVVLKIEDSPFFGEEGIKRAFVSDPFGRWTDWLLAGEIFVIRQPVQNIDLEELLNAA